LDSELWKSIRGDDIMARDSLIAFPAEQQFFDNKIHGKYLSSAELAVFLGLSEHTVRAWRKFRIITPVKLGRSVRWLLKDVLEELAKRRNQSEKS
jgi:predicted DNA-binding transcriptional regulator AlpA